MAGMPGMDVTGETMPDAEPDEPDEDCAPSCCEGACACEGTSPPAALPCDPASARVPDAAGGHAFLAASGTSAAAPADGPPPRAL